MKTKAIIYVKRTAYTLALPLLVLIIFGIITDGRTLSARMLLATSRQTVFAAIIAMALIFNMRMGMLDFSAGGVLFAAAIISGNLMVITKTGVVGFVLFSLIISILMTSLTGLLNNTFKVPTIVLTIGLVFIYESVPRLVFPRGVTIPFRLAFLAESPYCYIVFAVMFTFFYLLYNFTAFGHNIRALGGGQDLAEKAGLNSEKIKQISFTISGFFVGVAAVLYLSSSGQILNISPLQSLITIFDSFLGIFLGLFLSRYCNLSIAILIGIFTMTMLSNSLVAVGMPATSRDIMTGAFLFLLLSISANQARVAKWQSDRAKARRLSKG